jgi:hypothetical protein
MKKFLAWVLVAFLIFFIARHPAEAATIAHGLVAGLADVGTRLADFLARFAGGGP